MAGLGAYATEEEVNAVYRRCHAAFTDSKHRTSDGVSSSIADTWRTRANNKPLTIIRTGA